MQVARHIAKFMEYGVTNGGVTSSITYWDAIIPTEINRGGGTVVARSKEHRRHFVAACLLWKMNTDDMEMSNDINVALREYRIL